MNSTTLRQEANGSNAGGRILIKKTVSPTNESSFNINNQLSVASNSNNIPQNIQIINGANQKK